MTVMRRKGRVCMGWERIGEVGGREGAEGLGNGGEDVLSARWGLMVRL